MDSKTFSLILLITSSILCIQPRADGTHSVYFLDSSSHSYFHSRSSQVTCFVQFVLNLFRI
uniref:Uncharacterized protein n=1 Tax=Helianthus annuus TaxID=4232 RepID=A0A251SFJ5_HELAN